MNRSAQAILDAHFDACVVLSPSGDHRLEVNSACGFSSFTRDQVESLKLAIAEFESQLMFEDGRPSERQRLQKIAIARRRG